MKLKAVEVLSIATRLFSSSGRKKSSPGNAKNRNKNESTNASINTSRNGSAVAGRSKKATSSVSKAKTEKNVDKSKLIKSFAVFAALVIFIAAVIFTIYFLIFGLSPVHSVVTIEIGEPTPDAAIFAKNPETEITFLSGKGILDNTLTKLGDINLTVLVSEKEKEYDVILRVVDTTPPVATILAQYLSLGDTPSPGSFVTDIIDKTEVTVTFKEAPDFTTIGKKDISIILKDEGGNATELNTSAYIFDVNEGITLEAGTPLNSIPLQEFLMREETLNGAYDMVPLWLENSFTQEQLNNVGELNFNVILNHSSKPSKISIVDTTPPTGTAIDLNTWLGKTHEPLDFIEDAHDYSSFTAIFQTTPDFTHVGTQSVTILLEDVWGNKSEFTSEMTIQIDTIPPEIRGIEDINISLGSNILYREGVTVWDNADGYIDFDVDSSEVDNNKLGEYTVTYIATDSSGNETRVTATVTVAEFTTESLMEMIDVILEDILEPAMDETEKARAIHRWVRGRIAYGANAEREIERAAFRGLQRRTGDCFTYFAVSTLMLDRVGIENMEIRRTEGARSTNHYWSLINIDGIWYHFDSTPNIFGFFGFMFTSEEAARVSRTSARNYYAFDPALYPPIA